MLLLGDQPGVSVATITALVDGARGHADRRLRLRRRTGSSAVVRSQHVRDPATALHGDKAVWKLVDAGDDVVHVPVPGRVPLDVDTWDDYRALLESAG